MSIAAMASAGLARRPDFPPLGTTPQRIKGVAQGLAGATSPENAATATLKSISTYIPTEILTLYVALAAAVQHVPTTPRTSQWIAFWIFLVATPITIWLVFAGKLRSAQPPKALPVRYGTWPKWEMFAGPVAYVVWVAALPDTPFLDFQATWYSPAVAGVVVLIVSIMLGLLAPLFQARLQIAATDPAAPADNAPQGTYTAAKVTPPMTTSLARFAGPSLALV